MQTPLHQLYFYLLKYSQSLKNIKKISGKGADRSSIEEMKAFIERKKAENKVLEKLLIRINENQPEKQKLTS